MSGQNLLMHVDLGARKKWIEREKKKNKIKFPFKMGRGEGNKGKGEKNQSVGAKFFLLS